MAVLAGQPRINGQQSFYALTAGLRLFIQHETLSNIWLLDTPNLFQANECHLVAIEAECDDESCEVSKSIPCNIG
jgi:hypothetical protein